MTYDIYLTDDVVAAKMILRKHFHLCKCCDFDNVIWLHAVKNVFKGGRPVIHGVGYFDEDNLELPIDDPTPIKVCHFYVNDELLHGNTVILTPDVDEFIELINKYLK